MTADAIYVRVPPELKDKVSSLAGATGKSQNDVIIELVSHGLAYGDLQKQVSQVSAKLAETQDELRKKETKLQGAELQLALSKQQLANAERAKGHLERVLNTQVGKCTVCNTPVNLYGFAYQQCPYGHSKAIELYDEYKKAPGIGNVVVAGLVMVGGLIVANELLGGNNQKA